MGTTETELPGVGTKHTIEVATGEKLVIVEHRGGRWEIARTDAEDNVTPVAELQPREAAELGRILSRGEVSREDPRKQMLFQEFCIEWVKLDQRSPLLERSLQESGIRERTGASVIALIRPEGSIPSPSPETRFRVGDTLVVIGHRDQVERFVEGFSSISTET